MRIVQIASLSLPVANLSDVPSVVTMHGPFVRENRELFRRLRSPHVVAISEAQARGAVGIELAGVVHNGLPLAGMSFGLTPIEAMACGCPVVAFGRGSIPEIVQHGVSGFVVNDAEEMADAVLDIGQLDRAACRAYAVARFSAERMADGYEAIYARVCRAKG